MVTQYGEHPGEIFSLLFLGVLVLNRFELRTCTFLHTMVEKTEVRVIIEVCFTSDKSATVLLKVFLYQLSLVQARRSSPYGIIILVAILPHLA